MANFCSRLQEMLLISSVCQIFLGKKVDKRSNMRMFKTNN